MKKIFRNISIQKKLFITFSLLFLIIMLIIYGSVNLSLYKEQHRYITRELENITGSIVELVTISAQHTIVNYLKSEVIKVKAVVTQIYDQGIKDGLSDEEIQQRIVDYILAQKIGEIGYVYCIDSRGEVIIHPFSELIGSSLLEYDFIQTQIEQKYGYLEYLWQNPNETNPREKALYMAPFEPFGWIISASAYKEEFISLVQISDVRDSISRIRIGSNGYVFLIDLQGNMLIHPQYEGLNINDLQFDEEVNTDFFLEILENLNGQSTYSWIDEGKKVNKVLLYRYLPDLKWIVVSSLYLDDYTQVLYQIYYILAIIFIISFLLFLILSHYISRTITAPLNEIVKFINEMGKGDLSERLKVRGHDELSHLAGQINHFIDTIENEQNDRMIIEEENRILAQFTNGNPNPVMRVDEKGSILYINRASRDLMKQWGIAFNTKLPEDLMVLIHKLNFQSGEIEFSIGNRYYNIMVSYFENKSTSYLLISDITTKKENEYLLIMSDSVFSHTTEGIFITDPEGTILRINPAFSIITGYSEEDVIGENPRILKSDRHDTEFYSNMWDDLITRGIWNGEIWNRRKNGEAYPQWLTINGVKDDQGTFIHYVAVFKDISDIKKSEEKLRYQVSHDDLTGLPNRGLFEDRLNRAIARAERNRETLAVLFLDMDNFKHINDSMGHQLGDSYLQIMAERLKQSCRDVDTVARVGGDEFVILVPELTAQQNIVEISDRIQNTVGSPLRFNQHILHPSVSIGVTIFPEDGITPQMLLKNADLAMYKAKEMGKGTYSLFNQEMNIQVKKRIEVESRLKQSLENDEMFLVYQPKVSAGDQKIIGAEALIRWNNGELGIIPPGEFIHLAEETGFIMEMGDWVLEKALVDQKDFQSLLNRPFEMAVNLSARQLRNGDLIGRIGQIVGDSHVDPHNINLEITENAAMEDSEFSLRLIGQLRNLDLKISIDDFGTGYSSYNYLKQYRANSLKIDKIFVDELPDDKKTAAIMRNIIDLGHTLEMDVVAEGVEQKEQFEFLKEAGCDTIQGYYFYKPLLKDDLIKILSREE